MAVQSPVIAPLRLKDEQHVATFKRITTTSYPQPTPYNNLPQASRSTIESMVSHSITALVVTMIASAMTVTAQSMSFGADNFYVSNDVAVQPITFPNQYGLTIAGNFYVPTTSIVVLTHQPSLSVPPIGAV